MDGLSRVFYRRGFAGLTSPMAMRVAKAGDSIGNRGATARVEELPNLLDRTALLDCSEQLCPIQPPDEVRYLGRVGVESDSITVTELGAQDRDFEVGEHAEHWPRFEGVLPDFQD